MGELKRLSKVLSERGICSRREADKLIEQGLVLVNDSVARLGQKVQPSDQIEVLTRGQTQLQEKVTIALHKPVGYVSAQAEDGFEPAIRLIKRSHLIGEDNFTKKHLEGLAPAGRLDIDSKGLILFTQDGVVAKSIIGPESKMTKEYVIKTKGEVTETALKLLEFGLELDGKPLKRAHVKILRGNLLNMTLREGRKRQIRRMCEAVGLQVIMLKRIRVGPIRIDDLPEGKWRYLSENEVSELKKS